MIKKVIAPLLCLSVTALDAADLNVEQDFLKSLEEVSEIATKSKLNIDDMPAFVSILHRERLMQLGTANVYEALGQVPGVQLSREGTGVPVVVFRGATQKGEVKLMVDGVTINNAYRGSIYYYFDFPIELIERIEVIRGPGSVIYGSNAISGVINIITRSSADYGTKTLYGGIGSDAERKAGGVMRIDEATYRLSLDAHYQRHDREIDAGPDKGGTFGQSDHSLRDYGAGMHLKSGGFTLEGRLKYSHTGLGYGLGDYFESSNDKKGNINESIFLQTAYEHRFKDDLSLKLLAGYGEYTQKVEGRYIPDYIGNDDLILSSDYKEQTRYAEGYLKSRWGGEHELLAGLRYEHAKAVKTTFDNYVENVMVRPFPATDIIEPGSERDILSLYVNDRFPIGESLMLSAGLRWDRYDDFGAAFSPRLGVVYRVNEELNLKVMASRAFRAPSWIELYGSAVSLGDRNLQEERADTLEIGAVYRVDTRNTLHLNGFVSSINDMIDKEGNQYVQRGDHDFRGIEFQYDRIIDCDTHFSLLGSYVDAKDDAGSALPDVASYMAVSSLLYDMDIGVTSGSNLRYVSRSERAAGDMRSDGGGYVTFDQTFSYRYKKLSLRAGIKNLFDADIAYPAPEGTYVNDYPDVGRRFWMEASWEF